jgi:DNA-binding transcriptional MerR regulator
MPFNKPIEKRYFSITEVADQLGLTASQLRYWEKEFTPLKPRTNARGKRFYSSNDIEVIQQIAWLVKDQGYTIEGARKAMKKRSEVADAMTAAAPQSIDQVAIDQTALKERLLKVKATLEEWKGSLS